MYSRKLVLNYRDSRKTGTRLIPVNDVSVGLSVHTIGNYFAPKTYRQMNALIDISKVINNSHPVKYDCNSNDCVFCDRNNSANNKEKVLTAKRLIPNCDNEINMKELNKYNDMIASIDDKQIPMYSTKLAISGLLSKVICKQHLESDGSDHIIKHILSDYRYDYTIASKHSIIDYTLKYDNEFTFKAHLNDVMNEQKIVLNHSFKEMKALINERDICHPLVTDILKVWDTKYRHINCLSIDVSKPLNANEFKSSIVDKCQQMRYTLKYDWISDCIHVILDKYSYLLDINTMGNAIIFNTISSFMSRLLRQLIINNIEKWVTILETHCVKCLPIFNAKIQCKTSGASYLVPNCYEWETILVYPIVKLLEFTKNIERIESQLIVNRNKHISQQYLLNVYKNDFEVQYYMERVSEIYRQNDCNAIINRYEQEFSVKTMAFSDTTLNTDCYNRQQLAKLITDLKNNVKSLTFRSNVKSFGIFQIDCRELKLYVRKRIEQRIDTLIENKFCEIMSLAQYICNDFSKIHNDINKDHISTTDFVRQTNQCIEYKSKVNLMLFDVKYIEENWSFVAEEGSALINETDIDVLHRLYNWPKRMQMCFSRYEKHFNSNKSEIESKLRQRKSAFERRLHDLENILNSFQKKTLWSPFESIADNCQTLNDLEIQLNECTEESMSIIKEQKLLKYDTVFQTSLLDQLIQSRSQLDTLWKTANLFRRRESEWMSKTVRSLDLEDIRQSVDQMLTVSNQMVESFASDSKADTLIQNANSLRTDINVFKEECLPILEVLSNPVLNDRHWRRMSEIVGHQITCDSCKTVKDIISLMKPTKHIKQIQNLGQMAVKEHELDVFLKKMNDEWVDEWPEDALEIAANKFLEGENLEIEIKEKCAKAFKFIHLDCLQFLSLRQRGDVEAMIRVTPPLFVQLILTFKELLKDKQKQINFKRNRYLRGIEKLDLASNHVRVLRNQLITDFQPLLIVSSEETEHLMIRIEKETIESEIKKEIIATDEAIVNRSAADSQLIKYECTKELSQAVPAIISANNALKTLNSHDISILRSMKSPPLGVRMVLESVYILLHGCKPDRKTDPKTLTLVDNYWCPALRMLSNVKFMDGLRGYDKNHVRRDAIALVRDRYLSSRQLDPISLMKVSLACEGLAKWVRAVDIYDRVVNVIKPKREKLKEAETKLSDVLTELDDRKCELQKTCDLLQHLNDEFAAASKKKRELEENIEFCRRRVHRSQVLVDGLRAEKVRWRDAATVLSEHNQHIVGNVLLSAAAIVYTSALDINDRHKCLNCWKNYMRHECGLSLSEPFSIIDVLGVGYELRMWSEAGLPDDSYTVENAIIAHNCKQFPIIINKSQLITKWIQALHNDVVVFETGCEDTFQSLLFCAIKEGKVVLIENVQHLETNSILMQLIDKQMTVTDDIQYIKINNEFVEYSPHFKLYMCCKYRLNLMPKTMSKIIVINWPTSEELTQSEYNGSNDNILALQIRAEKETQLMQMEDQILHILSDAKINVLDDENVINLLTNYQTLGQEIASFDK